MTILFLIPYTSLSRYLISPFRNIHILHTMEKEAPSTKSRIAMISGPLSPSPTFFTTHYESRILTAIQSGHNLLLGPSLGIDRQALQFVLAHLSPSTIDPLGGRVAVYFFQAEEKLSKNTELYVFPSVQSSYPITYDVR